MGPKCGGRKGIQTIARDRSRIDFPVVMWSIGLGFSTLVGVEAVSSESYEVIEKIFNIGD
jgi:hypothetical protein